MLLSFYIDSVSLVWGDYNRRGPDYNWTPGPDTCDSERHILYLCFCRLRQECFI